MGSAFGWRVAFYAIGVPGLIVAAFVLTLNDPVRGINDIGDSGDNGVTYINNDSGSGNDNCNTSSTSDGDHSLDSYPLASLTPADKILKSELLSNHKNGGGRSFLEEIVIAWNELMEIINNKHFVCALGKFKLYMEKEKSALSLFIRRALLKLLIYIIVFFVFWFLLHP